MLKIRLCLIKKQHQCWLTIAASSLAWNFLQMDGSSSVLIGIIKFVLLWFPRIHWMGLTRYKLFAWVILRSGDSTVRLWDVTLGSLLDTCEIGAKAELSATDRIEEEPCHAVTDLCTCPNGTSIALAVQRQVPEYSQLFRLEPGRFPDSFSWF
ncbi:uncharacterized protein LOC115666744 isoform X2 [Syzygium oleosum]|uniref:uncharacterized protein LOC115666744 isoform X2 n=1 Tax=Syzygium oleosum TaxID=219896 RepID=UPI0024B8DCA1|nr:uncharacterized protein LOC115666744 isoform X2 [Syzygium oleosum]